MAYDVTFSEHAVGQLVGMPPAARPSLAAAIERIAADPGQGLRYDLLHPADMRTATFDEWGLIVYLVRAVSNVNLTGAGPPSGYPATSTPRPARP